MEAILKTSSEEWFLEQGWLLALGFTEGWACLRIQHKEWANLEPWSLGPLAALGSLATFDQIQTANNQHYLEPFDQSLIYHTFWGVTPSPVRIWPEYPPRTPIGSMLSEPRAVGGEVGYINARKSPFNGPFSKATELFTVSERYPEFQAYNPTNDAVYNVMLNFDQRHYTYQILTSQATIKEMLVGTRTVKKYTMGAAWPNAMTMPDWLKNAVRAGQPKGYDPLKYSLDVMSGKV
jgi:hypothetical protein